MRSFLTMLGIIIGVASVISIVTIGNSGKEYIIHKINEVGGESLSIGIKNGDEENKYNIEGLTDDDIETIKKVDSVQYVSPLIGDVGELRSTDVPDGFATVNGVNSDYAYMSNFNILHGRFFSEEEYEARSKVCVVNYVTANRFFGTENPIGRTVDLTINNQMYTLKIIGVVKVKESTIMSPDDVAEMASSYGMKLDLNKMGNIFIPATMIMDAYGEDLYGSVSVTTYDIKDLDSAGEQAVSLLNARHNVEDDSVFEAKNMATLVDLLDTVINIFTIFISAVGAISLIVGGIGVMNIMLVSVTERTREIGIRKALGARTNVILVQFLTESVIICLIGGIIGLALGFGMSAIVAGYMGARIKFDIVTVLIALGFSMLVGVFFGIYPARKAAKMPPIEALRQNG